MSWIRGAQAVIFFTVISTSLFYVRSEVDLKDAEQCLICEDVLQTYHDKYRCAGENLELGSKLSSNIHACNEPTFECSMLVGQIKTSCETIETKLRTEDQMKLVWESMMTHNDVYRACSDLGMCTPSTYGGDGELEGVADCHAAFLDDDCVTDIFCDAFAPPTCDEGCYLCNWLVKGYPIFQESCRPQVVLPGEAEFIEEAIGITPRPNVQESNQQPRFGFVGSNDNLSAFLETGSTLKQTLLDLANVRSSTSVKDRHRNQQGVLQTGLPSSYQQLAKNLIQKMGAVDTTRHDQKHRRNPRSNRISVQGTTSTFPEVQTNTTGTSTYLQLQGGAASQIDAKQHQLLMEAAKTLERQRNQHTRAAQQIRQKTRVRDSAVVGSGSGGGSSTSESGEMVAAKMAELREECWDQWNWVRRSRKARYFASWESILEVQPEVEDVLEGTSWDANIACKCLGRCPLDPFEDLGLLTACRYDEETELEMSYVLDQPRD